jgi:hypothetical protein
MRNLCVLAARKVPCNVEDKTFNGLMEKHIEQLLKTDFVLQNYTDDAGDEYVIFVYKDEIREKMMLHQKIFRGRKLHLDTLVDLFTIIANQNYAQYEPDEDDNNWEPSFMWALWYTTLTILIEKETIEKGTIKSNFKTTQEKLVNCNGKELKIPEELTKLIETDNINKLDLWENLFKYYKRISPEDFKCLGY